MHIIAWIIIVLNVINVLLFPLIIGRERTGKYGYADYISKVIAAVLMILVCLRVLGYI